MTKKPKAQPKKQLKAKTKQRVEPKHVSLTSRKSYWIILTAFMVVFGLVIGATANVSAPAIGMMIGSVLALIGLAFYLNFAPPSPLRKVKRAILIFAGVSIIGFLIWAATTLLLTKVVGLEVQIDNLIGGTFFAVTSLIICLSLGALIGDLIGRIKRVQESLGVFPEQN